MNLNAVLSAFIQNPIAFCGGFMAGVLRLDLQEDPLRTWLEQQQAPPSHPQNISIE